MLTIKLREITDSIAERDLTQAAQKVHKYLQENTPGTLAEGSGAYQTVTR